MLIYAFLARQNIPRNQSNTSNFIQGNMIFGKPTNNPEKAHAGPLERGSNPTTDDTAFYRSRSATDFYTLGKLKVPNLHLRAYV